MTATLTAPLIRAIFEEALTQEFGIRLPIEAAYHEKARALIHNTITGHPDRDKIMICQFPEDGEFWFVKKTVEVI